MSPWLCACLCLLLSACSAIPTWHHKGVVVVKEDLPAPASHIRPEYSRAQIAAAQAIRDAGEDAQLHMAMLKKKYLDIVRQNFYNAFAPIPFIRERLDSFQPNKGSLPVKSIPPPVFVHPAHNPCSGNILKCLHPSYPARLGKIVPAPSAGLQPCFGPNCNYVFNRYPMGLPRPSHSTHQKHKNTSKRPLKYHRICDRKKPDHDCHHRSTIWPSYATVKLNSQFSTHTTTNLPKETNVQSSSLQHFTTPSKDNDLKEFSSTTSHSVSHIPKNEVETLRKNMSKLENEILGIPEDRSPTSPSVITESPFESMSTKSIPATIKTTTESIPEFKEGVENVSPLMTSMHFIHTTPSLSFHINDVIEPTSPNPNASFDKEKSLITISKFEFNEESFNFSRPTEQEEMTTENLLVSINMIDINPLIKNPVEFEKSTTTTENENNYAGTIMVNKPNNTYEKQSTRDYTSFAVVTDKLELTTEPTIDNNLESKIGVEVTTFESLTKDYSPSPLFDKNDVVSDAKFVEQATPLSTVYLSEKEISRVSISTSKEESESSPHTVTPPYDYITRMFDQDLAETTSGGTLHEQSSESVFENINEDRESEATSTTIAHIQYPSQTIEEYNLDLGRENTETIGAEITDSQDIIEENHLSTVLFSDTDNSDKTTTGPESRENFVHPTKSLTTLNFNKNIEIEVREEAFTDSYQNTLYSTAKLGMNNQIHESEEEMSTLSDNNIRAEPITRESLSENISDFPLEQREYSLTTAENKIDFNVSYQENKEDREDISTIPYTSTYSAAPYFSMTQKSLSENEVIMKSNENFPHDIENNTTTELQRNDLNAVFTISQNEAKINQKKVIHSEDGDLEFSTMGGDLMSSYDPLSIKTESTSSSFEDPDEGKESLPTTKEQSNLFESKTETSEHWTTENIFTEYYPEEREELSSIDDSVHDLEENTLYQPQSTLLNSKDNLEQTPLPTENYNTILMTRNIGDLKLTGENNPTTNHLSAEDGEHLATDNTLIEDERTLQSREDYTENTNNESPTPSEIPPRISAYKDVTNLWEENTTPNDETENVYQKTITDETITNPTVAPKARKNIYEFTTKNDYIETIFIESEVESETKESTTIAPEGKSFESNLIEESFGQTDSPGLIVNEDWTERQTDDPFSNVTIIVTASIKDEPTDYPQMKVGEEEFVSEAVTEGFTKGTESIELESAKTDPILEVTSVTNLQSILSENDSKSDIGFTEKTTSIQELSLDSSSQSSQNGVLKFTSEIETTDESFIDTERTEEKTNPLLNLELNDGLRKVRSVKYSEEEAQSYPTTECVLCMLGLPHSHRTKRSSDNLENETKTWQREKPSHSFTPSLDPEDPESPGLYATTILELLPVIKEGYKNDAFSEDDKKVIRSIFGDMKTLIDEETFDSITESTKDLLMGDGARIDEIVEDTDYDSSEDGMSEDELRLKRSKNIQIMNDLLKKIPHSEIDTKVPSKLKNSRVVRSPQMPLVDASSFLALLSDKKREAIQLDVPDDEDEDEYEYYENEGDDYEDDSYVDTYEDDYDKPSIGELIKLARRHRERKARAEKS